MGHVAETLVTGAILAGTLAACGNDYPTNLIDSSDQQLIEETVAETGAFWAKQGVGLGNGLQTKVVVGQETFTCDGAEITSESMEITYCADSNTVGVSVGGVNELRSRNANEDAPTAIKTWLRTAVGGLVQNADPSLTQNAPADSEQRGSYVSWQRACLGGIATYNLHPLESGVSFRVLLHTGDSRTEGHWFSRAYAHGYEARTTDRSVCADIPLPPDWSK